jgi:hypothetical protein
MNFINSLIQQFISQLANLHKFMVFVFNYGIKTDINTTVFFTKDILTSRQ